MKPRALGILFLSLVVLLFSPTAIRSVDASHALCGAGGTLGSDSFSPAPGVYVSITSIACGQGRPTFSSTHHEVQCGSSGDWSFGSGSYTFEGIKSNGQTAYSVTVNTNGVCPNDSRDFGPKRAFFAFTDFSLTVTYIPTGETRTLLASASDCADRFCPV